VRFGILPSLPLSICTIIGSSGSGGGLLLGITNFVQINGVLIVIAIVIAFFIVIITFSVIICTLLSKQVINQGAGILTGFTLDIIHI
jgi:hypothetical protein